MPAHPKIEIGKKDSSFLLRGDINALLTNQRLRFSLKRLGFERLPEGLTVPFQPETEIRTLQELQDILRKFGFEGALSVGVQDDLANFVREEKNFQSFSERARRIRNDQFKDNPDLVAEFDLFQDVVGRKLVRKLYPLQLLSAFHMAFAQNACNFAVPGAGKTSIVYAAYAYLKNLPVDDPKHVDKLVVIGPLSSFAPWEREYHECFGQQPDSIRLSGDQKMPRSEKEEHLFSGKPAEITLIYHGGVETLQNEIKAFLKANKTMVVVDEAHRIKNPDGVWGKSIVEIGKEAQSRIILTGTPVPNGYEDLFNLFQYLYPFKYRNILQFHFGNLIEMSKSSDLDAPRVTQLTDNISPYFIRIKKSDLKLPPVQNTVVEVTMGERQREIYDYVETKYLRSFSQNSSGTVRDFLNKARLIRLRQAATNPGLLLQSIQATLEREDYESRIPSNDMWPEEFQDDSGILLKIADYAKNETPQKFVAAKDIVFDCLVREEKVIVWTIFIQNAKGLQFYLATQGVPSGLLIGEVEQSSREVLIDAFNDPENRSPQVLIANPFSVAESISLHKGCHTAIYLERDYNCSNFLQSKDRIHRVGLSPDQKTTYFYLLSKESIDGVIDERLEVKAKRMEKIIDSEIPLFARINDSDETDLIKALMQDYAQRT